MAAKALNQDDRRTQDALKELRGIIKTTFPTATFRTYRGEDPEGTYLETVIDVDDMNDVMDVYIDRLLDIQVKERLPVYVIPVRPPERVAQLAWSAQRRARHNVVIKRAQELVRRYIPEGYSLDDELLAERRADSA